jgi:hypothetical protein
MIRAIVVLLSLLTVPLWAAQQGMSDAHPPEFDKSGKYRRFLGGRKRRNYDPQLEKAVEVLMDQLRLNPPGK